MLAPFMRKRMEQDPGCMFGGGPLKDQGQPVDPGYLSEEVLQKKELDQGSTYFQLQHMLNTKLADALRFPLKTENLIVMRLTNGGYFPMTVARSMTADKLLSHSVSNFSFKTATPHEVSSDVSKLQGTIMYVDPAGGGKNGDETGYAVTGFLNGNIYLLSAGGLPGGYNVAVLNQLTAIAKNWAVGRVIIEKNMGYGAFREVWVPILRTEHKCAVDDDYVTGQKELRIIETLEPVMGRGSLIINASVVDEDRDRTAVHEQSTRAVYSLFHQMAKITRDRNCLIHDDRLDALEGAVRFWVKQLMINQSTAVTKQREREFAKWAADPLGLNRFKAPNQNTGSIMNRFRR